MSVTNQESGWSRICALDVSGMSPTNQESGWSHICALDVSVLPLSTNFRLDLELFPYCLVLREIVCPVNCNVLKPCNGVSTNILVSNQSMLVSVLYSHVKTSSLLDAWCWEHKTNLTLNRSAASQESEWLCRFVLGIMILHLFIQFSFWILTVCGFWFFVVFF